MLTSCPVLVTDLSSSVTYLKPNTSVLPAITVLGCSTSFLIGVSRTGIFLFFGFNKPVSLYLGSKGNGKFLSLKHENASSVINGFLSGGWKAKQGIRFRDGTGKLLDLMIGLSCVWNVNWSGQG